MKLVHLPPIAQAALLDLAELFVPTARRDTQERDVRSVILGLAISGTEAFVAHAPLSLMLIVPHAQTAAVVEHVRPDMSLELIVGPAWTAISTQPALALQSATPVQPIAPPVPRSRHALDAL